MPIAAFLFWLALPLTCVAQSFKDVPKNDPIYSAVEDLKTRGVLQGYADGTFRSSAIVSRAEAVKIIVTAAKVPTSSLSSITSSVYDDIPSGVWFLPYVEWSRKDLKIIDGPPNTSSFHPSRSVSKAEFIKMLLLSLDVDPNSYSEIILPLSADVTDTKAWFYPYIRLAVATSMTTAGKGGLISPNRELTRGDVALLLDRLLLYREGKRTQELLSEIEQEALTIVSALNAKDLHRAEYASARALLEARGAKSIAPDAAIVNGAVKVTEGYRALVRGYRAATEKKYEEAIRLYQDAWFIGNRAIEMSSSVKTYAVGIQTSAQKLAAEARAHK